jgi:hypothetical protein
MKTYTVTISGQQSHIQGNLFENRTPEQVNEIIMQYWDNDYPRPQIDGNNWELNGDTNIRIEEEKYNVYDVCGTDSWGIIESFATYEKAVECIAKFEEEDKANGEFVENCYSIKENE